MGRPGLGAIPPPLRHATIAQEKAWRLRVGITSRYERGSTPENIVESSELLWYRGFGCFRLIEDALAQSPCCQFFARDGNGVCLGTGSKKVQFVCTLLITMLQLMLCPTENMQTWARYTPLADEEKPDYPRQDLKLRHAQWLCDKILQATRGSLSTHLRDWTATTHLTQTTS